MKSKLAVVLSGGGARGAYQVGVLRGVSDVLQKQGINPDVRIYTGVSAGAINASFMAANAEDFHLGVRRLTDLWSKLTSEQVFASDALHMGKIAVTWATELGFGALTGTTPGKALLDTSPLKKLLTENLDVPKIGQNIRDGNLDALALTAVDYSTSNSITFVNGVDGTPSWSKSRRRSEKASIGVDHVMASSAIPMLFPPAYVGDRWFGDGCVRNSHPCASALYLGADRLLIIGVRRRGMTADDTRALKAEKAPSVARVINLLLNAVLLDGVELDVERMERVNEFVRRVPEEHRKNLNLKSVEYAMISPSADIGEIAAGKSSRLPRLIRYLLKGLGSIEDASEIVSYLLFDPLFCSQLIEIGREDAHRNEAEIIRLFTAK
jgi:NTE family protein